jgi:AraC-like DNA-binding protein
MIAASEPEDTVAFATDDPEAGHEFLREAFLDSRMSFRGDPGDFRLVNSRRDAGPFRIDEFQMSGASTFSCLPLEQVFVSRVRGGTHRVGWKGGGEVSIGAGDVALTGIPGVATDSKIERIDKQVVTLRPAAIAAAAAQDPHEEAAPVSFTGARPISPAHAQTWIRTIDAVTRLYDDADARAARLITGRTDRLLAAVTLSTFPNDAPAVVADSAARGAHSQTLRRAIAFIEARPDRDIAIADIAKAAHVTTRTVQHAFRRHLETTPMAYLRRVRLDHAHGQLVAAVPGDGETVARIALDWGFANPSRFARYYRDAYGRPPSETLAA